MVGVIENKIREEFKTILGPLGEGEFISLKGKNALSKDDLFEYIDSLTREYIISQEIGYDFKNRIGKIYGQEREVINENNDTVIQNDGDEVLIRD